WPERTEWPSSAAATGSPEGLRLCKARPMDARSAWNRFWNYDRLASFGTGVGAGNYGDEIAAGWREFFLGLPAGARVLDLCTGNGAIAVMALEAGDKLQVTGAD